MVAKAQKHADKKQDAVEVSWRGYKMKVKPNLPTFTKYDLDTILLQAVDTLVKMDKKNQRMEEDAARKERTKLVDDVFGQTDNPNNGYKLSKKKVGLYVICVVSFN